MVLAMLSKSLMPVAVVGFVDQVVASLFFASLIAFDFAVYGVRLVRVGGSGDASFVLSLSFFFIVS